jgi:hypothetical protein
MDKGYSLTLVVASTAGLDARSKPGAGSVDVAGGSFVGSELELRPNVLAVVVWEGIISPAEVDEIDTGGTLLQWVGLCASTCVTGAAVVSSWSESVSWDRGKDDDSPSAWLSGKTLVTTSLSKTVFSVGVTTRLGTVEVLQSM